MRVCDICGHGSVAERVLAKHETGFRLPLAALLRPALAGLRSARHQKM